MKKATQSGQVDNIVVTGAKPLPTAAERLTYQNQMEPKLSLSLVGFNVPLHT